MELNNREDQNISNENEDGNSDTIFNFEVPLAGRIELQMKVIKDQSNNEGLKRTESSHKQKLKLPEMDALDALNSWISEKFEKENDCTVSSSGLIVPHKNKLKSDSNREHKLNNGFYQVNQIERDGKIEDKPRKHKKKHKEDKKDCLIRNSGSPTFPRIKSLSSKIESKHKIKHRENKNDCLINDSPLKNGFYQVNQIELDGKMEDQPRKHQKNHRENKNDCLFKNSGSPTFPKRKSLSSKIESKQKIEHRENKIDDCLLDSSLHENKSLSSKIESKHKIKHKEDKHDCLFKDSESLIFRKVKSTSKSEKKTKRKTDISGHTQHHIDIDNTEQIVIDASDDEIHSPKKRTTHQISSDSDDDVIVCGNVSHVLKKRSCGHASSSSRSKRAKKSKRPRTPLTCTPGGTFGQPASPMTMQLVKQLEDDEMMARRLQEEFDAEQIPNSLAPLQDPSMSPSTELELDQLMMPSFEQHPGPIILPSFEAYTNQIVLPSVVPTHRERGQSQMLPANVMTSAWSSYDYSMHPVLQNYFNMVNTPRGRGRGRGRGRRNHRHHVRYPEEFDEQDNGDNYETLMNLAERLGPAIEKGLSAVEISQLPTFFYTPDCKIQNNSCSICMADYETGDNLRKLPCFHDYHDTCIDQWLAKNPVCPICRVEVQI